MILLDSTRRFNCECPPGGTRPHLCDRLPALRRARRSTIG